MKEKEGKVKLEEKKNHIEVMKIQKLEISIKLCFSSKDNIYKILHKFPNNFNCIFYGIVAQDICNIQV